MKHKKNILLFIGDLSTGGAQNVAAKLSVALSKYHNIYIAIFDKSMGINFETGGTVIDLATPRSKTCLKKYGQ